MTEQWKIIFNDDNQIIVLFGLLISMKIEFEWKLSYDYQSINYLCNLELCYGFLDYCDI